MVRHAGQLPWLLLSLSCSIDPGTLREPPERAGADAGAPLGASGARDPIGATDAVWPSDAGGSRATASDGPDASTTADAALQDGRTSSIESDGKQTAGQANRQIDAGAASPPAQLDGGKTNAEPVEANDTPLTVDAPDSSTTPELSLEDFAGVRWRRVAGGEYHTCMLTETGGAQCWGNNAYGQMGDGDVSPSNRFTPVDVLGVSDAISISAGQTHTCALIADGTVRCWGDNSEGQLGDGSRAAPQNGGAVTVRGLTGAVDVQAGTYFSCALLSTGVVECWGSDIEGQLGESTDPSLTKPNPIAVDDLGARCIGLAVGALHACALLDGGSIKCWGWDYWGQVGDGEANQSNKYAPALVDDITDATSVAAGSTSTCAVLRDGSAKCWGYAGWGQIGNGPTTELRVHSPVAVQSLSNVQVLEVGALHVCSLLADGSVWCWGSDDKGQLGNGPNSTANQFSPVQIIAPDSGVRELASGSWHNCVTLTDETLECWGHGEYGQLGMGPNDMTPRFEPTPALTF